MAEAAALELERGRYEIRRILRRRYQCKACGTADTTDGNCRPRKCCGERMRSLNQKSWPRVRA